MANPSVPTEANNIKNETHFYVDVPATETTPESNKTRPECRILHRVPQQLRENKNHIYSPAVLSLGPYHRNLLQSRQFFQVEEFKNGIVNNTLEPSTKTFFYYKILERVDDIRMFYGGFLEIVPYNDEALAEMMLLDAYFLLYYMEIKIGDSEKESYLVGHLGLSVVALLGRDFIMLENQIPFWIIKLFILKFHEENEGDTFLYDFLSSMCPGDGQRLTSLPWKGKEQEPLHLLEAYRGMRIMKKDTSSSPEHLDGICNLMRRSRKMSIFSTEFQIENSLDRALTLYHSVTDLKAKGIHFESNSYHLNDISFNSYAFHGKLLLPVWFVNTNTKILFSNIIAFEMSPGTNTEFEVLKYYNFMKSLLETPKDVKELRENGILISSLRNDEEVLQVFKEIDTDDMNDADIFTYVRLKINKHCDNRAKTWMAELIHTYFCSPWTAIGLFAATFLLCLTFLQTYYTINPKRNY